MIKNTIFDMGGVLIDYDPERVAAELFIRLHVVDKEAFLGLQPEFVKQGQIDLFFEAAQERPLGDEGQGHDHARRNYRANKR